MGLKGCLPGDNSCNCSSKSIGRKVTQAEEVSAFFHICAERNVIKFMI